MSNIRHITCLTAAIAVVLAAACSSEGPVAPTPNAPSFAKSGTTVSVGAVDTTTSASNRPAPSSGLVGTSFTARADSISNVPLTVYYAAPSTWVVGGHVFESTWLTRLTDTKVPFAVGACLTVTFTPSNTGVYNATDIVSQVPSKCP
ncbi:MAG: hypothetical protein JWM41_484 [Gemmatimonadetes bacterium]|nr:hypothetical protein [Gemmatimonadota bacterium]